MSATVCLIVYLPASICVIMTAITNLSLGFAIAGDHDQQQRVLGLEHKLELSRNKRSVNNIRGDKA